MRIVSAAWLVVGTRDAIAYAGLNHLTDMAHIRDLGRKYAPDVLRETAPGCSIASFVTVPDDANMSTVEVSKGKLRIDITVVVLPT
jgi:hypothetical protein